MCIIDGTCTKDKHVSAIVAGLLLHIKLSHLAHVIYNTLSQTGENCIKIGEDLPMQIPASCGHAALNRQKLVKCWYRPFDPVTSTDTCTCTYFQ